MLALAILTPSSWALPAFLLSTSNQTQPTAPAAQTNLVTTPTIASFLSDTWTPSSYVPNVYTAQAVNKEGFLANTTEAIYDFLNDTWIYPVASTEGIYTTNERGYLTEFLNPNWSPATAVELERPAPDYKKHVMS